MEHPTAGSAAPDPLAGEGGAPADFAVPGGFGPPDAVAEAVAAPPAAAPPALRRFRARWLALLAASGIALYVCWLMLLPFVEVLLWATVLAIVFYPVHTRIVARTRRPGWAALLSCVLVVGTIVVPLALVTLAVVSEARETAGYVQQNADQLLAPNTKLVRFINRYLVDLDRLAAPVPANVEGPPIPASTTRPATGLRVYLVDQLRNMSGVIAGGAVTGVTVALFSILKTLCVVITLYYLFRDGERIKAALFDSLPLERAQTQRIFDRTREVIAASVYGVLVIASIQAVLGELGFLAVGLPSPLLWGVVMFFLSMVPMAGSFLVWVPACLYLLATGHWVKAILLFAWCAGVVGTIDNVLRPRLVGKRTRLHELLVFFSVLGGLQVFGALGLVVGPVVVVITLALLDIFRKADRSSSWAEPTLAERQAALRNVPPDDEDAEPAAGAGTILLEGPRSNRKRRGRRGRETLPR